MKVTIKSYSVLGIGTPEHTVIVKETLQQLQGAVMHGNCETSYDLNFSSTGGFN
jgi:hypothetical protein